MGFFSVAQWPSRSPNVCHNILITFKMHPNHKDTAAKSLTRVLSRQRAILHERGLLSGKEGGQSSGIQGQLGQEVLTPSVSSSTNRISSPQFKGWQGCGTWLSVMLQTDGLALVCSQGAGWARASGPSLCSIL